MTTNPISILVVDDEPVLRELIVFFLRSKGFKVQDASNGNGAFELINKQHFDVVVSDVLMPGCSGIDLLRRIQALDSVRPQVFFVSGHSNLSREEAKSLGAADLLNTPVDFEGLSSAIVEAARSKGTESPTVDI